MLNNRRVVGIISEFNPFHNGHNYLINKIKSEEETVVVTAMSGNYVERGDIAIIDKFSRTEMAINSGCNLVVEIPVQYAMSTAERFAFAGAYLLNSLGTIDELVFGSECADTEVLTEIANYLLSNEFEKDIKIEIQKGITFAKARENAVRKKLGDKYAEVISNPNDILGIEYIKAIKILNSSMKPKAIQRIAVKHDGETSNQFASAMKIREMIKNNENISPYVPEFTYKKIIEEIENSSVPYLLRNNERSIISELRSKNTDELSCIFDMSEGIENKIIKSVSEASTLDELYELCKSKRYTLARIRRLILAAYLGITNDIMIKPSYIRVLGMDEHGKKLIKSESRTLPIVCSYKDAKKLGDTAIKQFEFEALCDDIYACFGNKVQKSGSYYKSKIISK